jgi:hypothetical protein
MHVPALKQKLTAALILLILCATPAFAAATIPALYDNGSAPNLPAATDGTLDITSPTNLIFRSANGNTLAIPYNSITAFNYRVESTHHLGVIPAILVALVNSRLHRHLFTLNYTDAANNKQIAVFDVPKDEPRVLLHCSVSAPPSAPPKPSTAEAPSRPAPSNKPSPHAKRTQPDRVGDPQQSICALPSNRPLTR